MAVLIFTLLFGAASAANALPCPMQETAAAQSSQYGHMGHSSDCPDHAPPHTRHKNCSHFSFADCLDLQTAAVKSEKPDEIKLLPSAALFKPSVSYKPHAAGTKTDLILNFTSRQRTPVFLLTKRILV